MSFTITPRVGYYYQNGNSIYFKIKQKYSDPTLLDKLIFHCLDSAVLNNNWINESTSSQAKWSLLGTEYVYDAKKIFPNQPLDTFFDLPFVESNGTISFDMNELAQYGDSNNPTIINTIPAIRNINEVSITYPSNAQAFTDPPVITAFNPNSSVDVRVYYGNNLPLTDFGKIEYTSTNTYKLNTALYLFTDVLRYQTTVPVRKKMTVSKYRTGTTWTASFENDDDINSYGCVQTGDTFQ